MRVAVLISGSGTNLQALLDAAALPGSPFAIDLVVSNRPEAPGLGRARRAGVAAHALDHRAHPDRPSFEAELTRILEAGRVDLVCLAGFMRVLTADFVARWHNRLVNIHPSLLPAFPGLDTHARALAAGVRLSGCTVHLVRAEVDSGPILVQGVVPVLAGDTPEALRRRVLEVEHRCYPRALRLLAEGRLRIDGDEVVAEDSAAEAERLVLHPALARQAGPLSAS
jgi:phosphoribosylglycinamide formyltransferase-1